MDILRKLQSILAPPTSPEVRSRAAQLRPETPSPFSFNRTLGDAIQMDPFCHLKPIETESIASEPIPMPPPGVDPPIVSEPAPDPAI
ncbi:MAG: hypothetical protein ABI647_16820, partial [Gemmatimonadota bacterium]